MNKWGKILHIALNFLVTRYLWLVGRIWRHIPERQRCLPVSVRYGTHLHSLVLKFADRRQNHRADGLASFSYIHDRHADDRGHAGSVPSTHEEAC